MQQQYGPEARLHNANDDAGWNPTFIASEQDTALYRRVCHVLTENVASEQMTTTLIDLSQRANVSSFHRDIAKILDHHSHLILIWDYLAFFCFKFSWQATAKFKQLSQQLNLALNAIYIHPNTIDERIGKAIDQQLLAHVRKMHNSALFAREIIAEAILPHTYAIDAEPQITYDGETNEFKIIIRRSLLAVLNPQVHLLAERVDSLENRLQTQTDENRRLRREYTDLEARVDRLAEQIGPNDGGEEPMLHL